MQKQFKEEPDKIVDSFRENTFLREMEEVNYSPRPIKSPPSVANAMKALQNKIKILENDKKEKENVILDLQKCLAHKNTETK